MAKNLLNYDGLTYFLSKLKTWILAQGYTTNTGTITKVKTTAGTHTAIDVSSGAAEFNVPTNTSHLSNDSNFPSDANYVHTDNNYTTTEKNKLAGIASGAEVNQSAFSNVKVGTTTVAADAKTDTLTLEAGDNITITPDATNDKITIAATDTTYNNATTSVAGLMSAEDKTKLNGIASGAEVNVVKSVDTTAGTSGINLSLSSAGKLDVTISGGSIASGNANFVTGGTVYSTTSTLAPKDSPALTGTPTAPTASTGTNTTQIATTAFVNTSIANAQTGRAAFQGAVDSNSEISGLSAYSKGYHWIVQTAGTYVGQVCEVGDMIYCIADKDSAYSADDFTVIQNNLDISIITNAEIDALFAS